MFDFLKKKDKGIEIGAPVKGKAVPISQVSDPTFGEEILGKGVAIQPADGKIPSLTVEKQKNGCKASKINACSRFLFRNDMCYCAIFFTLW